MKKEELIKKYGLEKPFKSWKPEKKKAVFVKNIETGNVKTIHYGDANYKHNYSKEANKRFRIRHGCDPVSELKKDTAKYWACQDLWSKNKWE